MQNNSLIHSAINIHFNNGFQAFTFCFSNKATLLMFIIIVIKNNKLDEIWQVRKLTHVVLNGLYSNWNWYCFNKNNINKEPRIYIVMCNLTRYLRRVIDSQMHTYAHWEIVFGAAILTDTASSYVNFMVLVHRHKSLFL